MVVITAAAVAIGNAENTVNGAYRAPNTCTDSTTNGSADGTRSASAFISSLLRTAHDALCVSNRRNGEKGHGQRRRRKHPDRLDLFRHHGILNPCKKPPFHVSGLIITPM